MVVGAVTPEVPGCAETPLLGVKGTLERCSTLFDESMDEAASKQALESENVVRGTFEWIDVDQFAPDMDVDVNGYDVMKSSWPYLFVRRLQLNGVNGEVTGKDDVLVVPIASEKEESVKPVVRPPLGAAEVARRNSQSAADRNANSKRRKKEAETTRHRKTPNDKAKVKPVPVVPTVKTPVVKPEASAQVKIIVKPLVPVGFFDVAPVALVAPSNEVKRPPSKAVVKPGPPAEAVSHKVVGGGGINTGAVNTPNLTPAAKLEAVVEDPVLAKKAVSPSKERRRLKRAERHAMDFQQVRDFVEAEVEKRKGRDGSVYPMSQLFVNAVAGPNVSTHARLKIFHRLTIPQLQARNAAWGIVLQDLLRHFQVLALGPEKELSDHALFDEEAKYRTIMRVEILSKFREQLAKNSIFSYDLYSPQVQLSLQAQEYAIHQTNSMHPYGVDPMKPPRIHENQEMVALRLRVYLYRRFVLPNLVLQPMYRHGYRVAENLIPSSNNDGIRKEHISIFRCELDLPGFKLRVEPGKDPPVTNAFLKYKIVVNDPSTDYLRHGVSSSLGKIQLNGREREFKVVMLPKASTPDDPIVRYLSMKNSDTGAPLKLRHVELPSRKPKNSFGRVSKIVRMGRRFRYFLGHIGQYYVRKCMPAFAHDVNIRRSLMQLESANDFKANHEVAFWDGTRTSNLGYDGYEENVLIEDDLLGELLREHASTNSFSVDLHSRLLYTGLKWLNEHTDVPKTEIVLLNNTVRYAYLQLQIGRATLNEVLVTTSNSIPS